MTSLYKPPSQGVLYQRDISIRKSPFIRIKVQVEPSLSKKPWHTNERVFFGRLESNMMNVALTFAFPGIPTSHSIKFIDPSADFAGLA